LRTPPKKARGRRVALSIAGLICITVVTSTSFRWIGFESTGIFLERISIKSLGVLILMASFWKSRQS
jgi:hypothetical protein